MAAARRKIALFNFHPAFAPPTSGGEARCFHLWRGLARRFEIEAVTPTFPEAVRETVEHAPGLRETRIPKKDVHVRWHQRLGRFAPGLPECSALVVALAGAKDKEFLAAAESALDGADAVILENPFLPFIKPRPGQVVVYESFNVEYLLQRENGSGLGGAWATRKTRKLEQDLARSCDIVFACSREDARIFQDDLGAAPERVFVAPNGVDLSDVPAPLFDDAEKNNIATRSFGVSDLSRLRVIFMGSRFPPNVVAAKRIVEKIAPETPEADFFIAGKCVEALASIALPPNVKAVGWLDDRAAFLRMAHVALNPVAGGSGTNVKMLDFLGAGLPSVATPAGARGLDLVSGVNAIVAELDGIPQALRDLAQSPACRRRLGLAGRRHVEKRFQWSVIADGMADIIEHRLAPRRVLTLVDYPVEPADHGGRIRVLEQARSLAAGGWASTILSLNKQNLSGATLLAPGVIEATVPRDPAHNALDERLQRDAGGICVDDLTCFTESGRLKTYRKRARELAKAHQAAILSHPYLAAVAEELVSENGQRLPLLHDAHNFELALKRTLFQDSPLAANVAPAFRDRLLSDFERCEGEALRAADALAATSPQDLENLRGHYQLNGSRQAFVAPNGASVREAEPVTPELRAQTRRRAGVPADAIIAVFLGSAHLPNADAAAFILRDLAPRLPNMWFFLVGGASDTVAHLHAPQNVRLFSAVNADHKTALLELCDIAINPVEQGSGTNLKLLEFLARGLPTVATPVGARGVEAEPGRDLLVATRDAMANALAELAASPAKRADLAQRGRALAERLYDWSATQRGVLDWLNSLPSESGDKISSAPAKSQ
jgi:glycosyltransferase involved in cell wall biosynthesis